jgi:hypothetical protein
MGTLYSAFFFYKIQIIENWIAGKAEFSNWHPVL